MAMPYEPVPDVPAHIRRAMSELAKRKRVVTPAMLEQRRKAAITREAKRKASLDVSWLE